MNKKICSALALALSIFLTSCSQDEFRMFDIPRVQDTHTHAVDLGLSVKWACCNIGAEYPEEYGNYYAWGDSEEKDSCIWTSYKWHNDSTGEITKYNDIDGKTTLDTSDDIAQIMWGEEWRMPTQAEIQELIDCCTWEWTSINGVNGYIVSGNGNFIFLPASGSQYEDTITNRGSRGCYMSATLYSGDYELEVCLGFNKKDHYIINSDRCDGHSIRPVKK